MSRKAFDADAMFWDAEDLSSGWTVTTKNSSSIDLKGVDMNEDNPPVIQWYLDGPTSGGSATLAITLQDSADNSTFAAVTPLGIASVATAFDHASLVDIKQALPIVGLRRYVRLSVVVGTAALTGGTLNAGLV